MQTLIELLLLIKSRYFIPAVFLPGLALLLLDPGRNLGQFKEYSAIRQSIMIYFNTQVIVGLVLPLLSDSIKDALFDKTEPFKTRTYFLVLMFATMMTFHLVFAWGVFFYSHELKVFIIAFAAILILIGVFVAGTWFLLGSKMENQIDA